MQDELAALSSDSVHMTAVKAGHNVHLDEPLLVVQAIRDLVERCRVAGCAPRKAAQDPFQEGTL